MSNYKAPGVYVEEISKLPPSVTQEPTSVAVFIGYTEKISDEHGNDLKLKPVRIWSAIEYTAVFGNTTGGRYLYDAVCLFYGNGGGECYIISIGAIDVPVLYASFENALQISREIKIQLLLIPDSCLLPPGDFSILQQKMLEVCADLQDRFAILDTLAPTGSLENDMQNFRAGIGSNNLKWGAAYYPWLILQDGKQVPPSGTIAGVCAATDNSRGVWKAPANISLKGVKEISVQITDSQQENMNIDTDAGKSVNAIRAFTGKGILVWGARTLAGNDNEWKYVSVRRLFIMVEQSIKNSISWVVFEPNDVNTWVKVKAMIESYLVVLWRNGALAGTKPGEAFYVKTGLVETMTPLDIAEGRLIVEVGLAVLRPAEFIVFRFSHSTAQC